MGKIFYIRDSREMKFKDIAEIEDLLFGDERPADTTESSIVSDYMFLLELAARTEGIITGPEEFDTLYEVLAAAEDSEDPDIEPMYPTTKAEFAALMGILAEKGLVLYDEAEHGYVFTQLAIVDDEEGLYDRQLTEEAYEMGAFREDALTIEEAEEAENAETEENF